MRALRERRTLFALDRENLYQDLVAELQLVADVADAMFGDFD